MKTIQIYASIECPYAYLATYRLTKVLPEYQDRVQIFWRALSLEYINHTSPSKPVQETERLVFAEMEPGLPIKPWTGADWQWPTTFWPAFEALACAQAHGAEATLAYSWALRQAYFAQGRNITMRHELLSIAEELADEGYLYLPRFRIDWDSGRWKHTILAESWQGWKDLKREGSATFILPDGSRYTNPAVGEIDIDDDSGELRSYTLYRGDPLDTYREMFERALR
jgi:hypothetical protein